MSKKEKCYVVWKGRKTGIFRTWELCRAQVDRYAGAEYKAFDSYQEAEQAAKDTYRDHVAPRNAGTPKQTMTMHAISINQPIPESYAVDAACTGNPGELEYRCVHVATGVEIFREGPFGNGTNNIGEFLAIVDALRRLQLNNLTIPVYSDSKVAIGWVKNGRCRTRHQKMENNAALFQRIATAECWLQTSRYENQLLKWDTNAWGEIPADFGRKR